jgi:hypothetical protein
VSSEFLDDRRKSLEDEFFHKESQKDLAKLREKLAKQTTKDELRKASGMEDDAVLDKLVALDISAETVAALSLVPLLKVAWADGAVQDRERDAILQGAEEKGIAKDSPAFELLEGWLSSEPEDKLFDAWAAYIKALRGELSEEQGQILKNQVIRFAQVVAEAAGGFLGIGKVSAEEKAAMAWIEAIFDEQ